MLDFNGDEFVATWEKLADMVADIEKELYTQQRNMEWLKKTDDHAKKNGKPTNERKRKIYDEQYEEHLKKTRLSRTLGGYGSFVLEIVNALYGDTGYNDIQVEKDDFLKTIKKAIDDENGE